MTIQRKLLVLLGGSERCIQTVNYVKDFMPVDDNTRIVLFHVFSGIPEEYRELAENPDRHSDVRQLEDRETEQQRKIRAYLEQAKELLVSAGFAENNVEIKFHPPENGIARDIIDEARNGYSAVVMRRRGMGALKSIILGSVAVKLLQSLTFIPIIFVGRTPPVKRMLLAVDTSPCSMKAVEFVASLLGDHRYDVRIFHSIRGLGAISFDLSDVNQVKFSDTKMPDNRIEAFKTEVARLFQVIKYKLMASGVESEKISEKIVSGVPSRSEAIIKEAEKSGCSTIVVGRRGLSKVEAFFMGRVGHKVVYGGNEFTVWVV